MKKATINRKTNREATSNARKIMAVICCLMIASLSLIIAGCGDQTDKYVGTWKLFNVSGSGGTVWMPAKVYGLQDSKIVFKENAKCEMVISEDKDTGTWKINEDGEIIISLSGKDKEVHLIEKGDGILQSKGAETELQFKKE